MKQIPKIIHQIWSGLTEPLPEHFQLFGQTWKECHPDWQYEYWDHERMNRFINEFYPEYAEAHNGLKYNIQRWDMIRYFILYKMGGMYVDFDYKCFAPLDDLLENKSCCFSAEPEEHAPIFKKQLYFNNALIASVPEHPFIKLAIEKGFEQIKQKKEYPDKMMEVLETTGPLLLTNLYEQYSHQKDIQILPARLVSPFTKWEIHNYIYGNMNDTQKEELEKKMDEAVAIHYFLGGWL